MKNCIRYAGIIVTITWAVAIIYLLGACVYLDNTKAQRSIEDYNNGICRKCGKSLEDPLYSRDKNYHYDYYICSNGHVVEAFKGR